MFYWSWLRSWNPCAGPTVKRELVNQGYHHALLAHGHAVRAVREFAAPDAVVGVVHNPPTPIPVFETPAHIEAVRQDYIEKNDRLMAPLFKGGYLKEWLQRAAQEVYEAKTFYITENGSAFDDNLSENGEVLDFDRRELLRNYLISLHRAVDEGFDVRGYFLWSLMDTYEWAESYAKRFGITYVDYDTQKRTPKLSAQWYREVVKANRVL